MSTRAGVVLPGIRLKAESQRRVARGHRWIFSNEIASKDEGVTDGGEVAVFSAAGEFLGSALYSAKALIAGRLYSKASVRCDESFLRGALAHAIAFRARFHDEKEAFRVVYGDADGLPGLVVDAFNGVLVMSIQTVGMDHRRDIIVALLKEMLKPIAIIERSEGFVREIEGLPNISELIYGHIPNPHHAVFQKLKIPVDPMQGQKTGLFLDQAINWRAAERWAKGAKVLDLFCHVGGWGLHALVGGAKSVTAVDESGDALAGLKEALTLNNLADGRLRTIQEDVFTFLRNCKEQYDLIVCDPPAFAKNRKSLPGALRGYGEINRLAMKHLEPGGILISCSCSHHVTRDDFFEMLQLAARDVRRQFRILPLDSGQSPDHAPLLSTPETTYLKVVALADQPDQGVSLRRQDASQETPIV
jgi:23S rRNA (cytosine1962-C5)-methyltransferase